MDHINPVFSDPKIIIQKSNRAISQLESNEAPNLDQVHEEILKYLEFGEMELLATSNNVQIAIMIANIRNGQAQEDEEEESSNKTIH